MTRANQESRSERIAVAATPTEKRAVRFLADALNSSESDVMRDMTMEQVLTQYSSLRERLGLLSSGDVDSGKVQGAEAGAAKEAA
jgi:hypothetical protein